MQYRRPGRGGLQASQLSPGSWVTHHSQVSTGAAKMSPLQESLAAIALLPRPTADVMD
jgi:hypothetical protein